AAINYGVLRAAGMAGNVPAARERGAAGLAAADRVVSAPLGTGPPGAVRQTNTPPAHATKDAREKTPPVALRAGKCGGTGQPPGACVRADHTATFVARKVGFDSPEAPHWTGEVHVIDIGIPRRLLQATFEKRM